MQSASNTGIILSDSNSLNQSASKKNKQTHLIRRAVRQLSRDSRPFPFVGILYNSTLRCSDLSQDINPKDIAYTFKERSFFSSSLRSIAVAMLPTEKSGKVLLY